jgi:protein-disulfide isomerase
MTNIKRDVIKAQRMRKKRQQRLNTILWVGGFIGVLVIILISPTIYTALKPAGDFIRITPVSYQLVEGKSIGNPAATVKIELYEDFQCPGCKIFTDTVEKRLLASNYITNGQVYYTFRQFPFLDSRSITKESQQAANASMCAMEQDRFWDYHDILFANQGSVENGGSYNDKRLQAFAESLGLDMTAFNQCFNTNKYAADIEADRQLGIDTGVIRTPTILINGINMFPETNPTYDELTTAIDAALASGIVQ